MHEATGSTDTPNDQVRKVIAADETLIWAGKPDVVAMRNGATRLGPTLGRLSLLLSRLAIVALAIYIAINRDALNGSDADNLVNIVLAGIAILVLLGPAFSTRQLKSFEKWASQLTYGITDRRALILQDGAIAEEYTIAEINEPKMKPRMHAPDFSDITWGRTVVIGGSDRPGFDMRKRERLTQGFKALADGDTVLRFLRKIRAEHIHQAANDVEAFVEATPAAEEASNDARQRVTSPTYGFSVDTPAAWNTRFRFKKVALGKFGIENEEQWEADADAIPNWNVVRCDSPIGSYVEVQVHKVKPINTLDKMINSKAAKLVGLTEVVDQNASVDINGLPGFYLTRVRTGNQRSIKSGDVVNESTWHMRQYVLHDGTNQYYIEALWPQDAPSEKRVCEAVARSLRLG